MSDTPEGYIIDYTETSSGCHCAWCGKAIHSQMSYFSKDYSKAYCDWCFDNIMRPDPDEYISAAEWAEGTSPRVLEAIQSILSNAKLPITFEKSKCTCTLESLMRSGCACGGK